MIAVKLEGRLGNQLFQYAFAYASAKKLETDFYLDKRTDYFLLEKYFNTPNPKVGVVDRYLFSITGFKNIFSHHLRRAFYQLLVKIIKLKTIYLDSHTEPLEQISILNDRTLYTGFFQSEKYFRPCKEQLLTLFTLKKSCIDHFVSVMKKHAIPKNYVAVHIRRGDYLGQEFELGYDYFHRLLKSLHQKDNFYVFLSDDPDSVADEFKEYTSKYISTHPEIIDFQFIANASACIISNSSFSWWAAYLNPKKPRIIAPKFWFGDIDGNATPHSIIPEGFTAYDWRDQEPNV